MSFLIRPGVPLYRAQIEARARDAWRTADQLVWDRWSEYVGADSDTRAGAYAAYRTALETEAEAADRLQSVSRLTEAA